MTQGHGSLTYSVQGWLYPPLLQIKQGLKRALEAPLFLFKSIYLLSVYGYILYSVCGPDMCVLQPVENRGHWTPEITVMSHLLVLETEPRSSARSVSDLNH